MSSNIPTLIAALRSNDLEQRRDAAEKLALLGADAQPAALALVESLVTDDDDLREWLTSALEGLRVPPSSDIEPLSALLNRESLDVPYWAATLLGRLGPEAAAAVPDLAEAVRSHREASVRQRAVWALGKIGDAAAGALPVLQAAAGSNDQRLAGLAKEAIKAIGS